MTRILSLLAAASLFAGVGCALKDKGDAQSGSDPENAVSIDGVKLGWTRRMVETRLGKPNVRRAWSKLQWEVWIYKTPAAVYYLGDPGLSSDVYGITLQSQEKQVCRSGQAIAPLLNILQTRFGNYSYATGEHSSDALVVYSWIRRSSVVRIQTKGGIIESLELSRLPSTRPLTVGLAPD